MAWAAFALFATARPHAYRHEEQRLLVRQYTDSWEKLGAAYHVLGDQPALEKLVEGRPAVAAGIGNLYAADEDWERAIAVYTSAITPETKDANLLAKRAEGYEKLEQWDLAVADWTRASQLQPDVAFQRFKPPGAGSWQFQPQHGGAGSIAVVDGGLELNATVATGVNWHVKAYQSQLRLQNGAEYVIRFKMKSPDACAVRVHGMIDEGDFHNIGLSENYVPPTEFQDYEFTFTPHEVAPENNRIGFDFGTNQGKVIVKEIVLLKKSEGVDYYIAQGIDYAQQGRSDEAVAAFTRVLPKIADGGAKARIIAAAAPLAGALEKLAESVPSDGQFQAELARHYAEQGNAERADAARAKALALFEQQLANKPASAALVVDQVVKSGSVELIAGVLDLLKGDRADEYAKIFPGAAIAAAEAGQVDAARVVYARLAQLQPENERWPERLAQLQPNVLAAWNFETSLGPWGAAPNCQLAVQDDVLTVRTTGADPYFSTPARGPSGAVAVVLRYRVAQDFTMQVFWADATGGFAESRHVDYPISAAADEWKVVEIPFVVQGALESIRLDPNTAGEHPLEIDSIVLRRLEPAEYAQFANVLIEPELARLGESIEADPTAAAYDARARFLARLGRWREAAADFVRLVEVNLLDRIAWFKAGNCLILAGDEAGYRQHCRAMVEQFRGTSDPQIADSTCKTCVLRPGAIELSELPIQMVQGAVDDPASENVRHWFVGCCALMAYREAKPKEAIAWTEKTPNLAGQAGALALAVRAMAEYRLGQVEQSAQTLKEAEVLIPAELRTLGAADYLGPLPVPAATAAHDWLAPEIVRREAAALLQTPPPAAN